MPVAAVAIAVVAIGYAAATVSVLAVVAAVGATIAAIGAVTGNKTLSMVGAAIGIVGGVASLAQGAGLIGDLAIGGSSATAGAGAGVDGLSQLAADGGESFTAGADASGTAGGILSGTSSVPTDIGTFPAAAGSQDIIDSVSGGIQAPGSAVSTTTTSAVADANPLQNVAQNAVSPEITPAAASDTAVTPTPEGGVQAMEGPTPIEQGDGAPVAGAGTQDPDAGVSTATAPPNAPSPLGSSAGSAVGSDMQGILNPVPNPAGAVNSGAAGAVTGANPTTAAPSIWDKILNTVGKQGIGTVLSGVIQAGGAFISGATSTLTPAQVKALDAQAQANIAASNLAQQQLANMQSGVPTASRNPVTAAPISINSPRPTPPPVTGSVAPAATQVAPGAGLLNQPPQAPVTGAPQ